MHLLFFKCNYFMLSVLNCKFPIVVIIRIAIVIGFVLVSRIIVIIRLLNVIIRIVIMVKMPAYCT